MTQKSKGIALYNRNLFVHLYTQAASLPQLPIYSIKTYITIKTHENWYQHPCSKQIITLCNYQKAYVHLT